MWTGESRAARRQAGGRSRSAVAFHVERWRSVGEPTTPVRGWVPRVIRACRAVLTASRLPATRRALGCRGPCARWRGVGGHRPPAARVRSTGRASGGGCPEIARGPAVPGGHRVAIRPPARRESGRHWVVVPWDYVRPRACGGCFTWNAARRRRGVRGCASTRGDRRRSRCRRLLRRRCRGGRCRAGCRRRRRAARRAGRRRGLGGRRGR
jgi:hypothetical protein